MSVTKSCTHLYQIDDKCFLLLVVGCQEKQASSVPFDQHFTEGGDFLHTMELSPLHYCKDLASQSTRCYMLSPDHKAQVSTA